MLFHFKYQRKLPLHLPPAVFWDCRQIIAWQGWCWSWQGENWRHTTWYSRVQTILPLWSYHRFGLSFTTRCSRRWQTSPAPVPPPGELYERYASTLILAHSLHCVKAWRHPQNRKYTNISHCRQRKTQPRPQVTCTIWYDYDNYIYVRAKADGRPA